MFFFLNQVFTLYIIQSENLVVWDNSVYMNQEETEEKVNKAIRLLFQFLYL